MTKPLYSGVQALRFCAALVVVLAHATLAVSERLQIPDFPVWRNGGVGVLVFFTITGFVMMISLRQLPPGVAGARVFASRRVLRIVPMYWLATTLKLAALVAVPSYLYHSRLDWVHVLCSYLFVPAPGDGGEIVEGVRTPLHAVGWTLQYEMYFYALFAIAVAWRKPPLRTLAIFFVPLIGLRLMLGVAAPPLLAFYGSRLSIHFVLGMAIALLADRGAVLGAKVGVALLVGSTSWLLLQPYEPAETLLHTLVCWTIPVTLIVAVTVLLEPALGRRVPRWLLALGDASYSLYLFHPFVIAAVAALLRWCGFAQALPAVVLMTLASVMVCQFVYLRIERPVTAWLKRSFVAPARSAGDVPVSV